MMPNDPSSATQHLRIAVQDTVFLLPMRRVNCNSDALAGFVACNCSAIAGTRAGLV